MGNSSSTFEQEKVAERFSLIHEDNPMTQKQFADELGLSLKTIQNYLYGYREISATAIHALIRKFGVNPRWLLTGEGEMYEHTQDTIALFDQLTPTQQLEIKAAIEEKHHINQMSEEIERLKANQ